jgi:polysaccharide biosynthesis protein PslJ
VGSGASGSPVSPTGPDTATTVAPGRSRSPARGTTEAIQFGVVLPARNPARGAPGIVDFLLGRSGRAGAWSKDGPTVAVVLLCSAVVAVLTAGHPKYGVLAGVGILAVGLYAVAPIAVVAAAIPATLLVARVLGGSSSVSVSDLVLALATFAALPYLHVRESPVLRRLLGFLVVYEAALLLTVVDNPYRADVVEWFHELFLVGGSLIVGFVVARQGKAKAALSTFLGGSTIVAVWECAESVRHHFQVVSLPLGMQKNFIGVMLMFAVFVAFMNPDWVGWHGRWHRTAMYICALGILASQSRQAMIGCAVGVVVAAVRTRRLSHVTRRSKILIGAMIPLVIIAYVTVSRELSSTNRFNSVHQRQTWFHEAVQVWHASPWLGVGLRWWYTTRFPFSFQPPNAELEMLTSAGVVGLAAFLFLFGRSLTILWRLPIRFGTFAFTAVLMRLVEGQFDIFWVSASAAIPWLLVGLALGALALEDRRKGSQPSEPAPWESAVRSPP